MAQPAATAEAVPAAPAAKYKGTTSVTDKGTGNTYYAARIYDPRSSASDRKYHSLGHHSTPEAAARAFDVAALALRGPNAETNFPAASYTAAEIEAAAERLRQPANVKTSKYVGVRLKKGQLWDARVRQNFVRVHLGYFKTEEEAAVQYDLAQLILHGGDPSTCGKTNFDWSDVSAGQIDAMSANVRLRMSGKLLPETIERVPATLQQQGSEQQSQQSQQQQQQQQEQQYEQKQAASMTLQQQQQRYDKANRRLKKAKRKLKGAKRARKKVKQRAQQLPKVCKETKQELKAAKMAVEAARQAVQVAKEKMAAKRQLEN